MWPVLVSHSAQSLLTREQKHGADLHLTTFLQQQREPTMGEELTALTARNPREAVQDRGPGRQPVAEPSPRPGSAGLQLALWVPPNFIQSPTPLALPPYQIQLLERGAGCATGKQNKANSSATSINFTASL